MASAGVGAYALTASSSVVGTTQMTNTPDTTNGAGGSACGTSANGNTWAMDQFPSVTLTATQETTPANTWEVAIRSTGSFVGFADPLTCSALKSSGPVSGVIYYTVQSATAPVPGNLKQDYAGGVEFSTLIDDFFGDSPTISGGNVYSYSYQGGNYTQVGTDTGGLIVTGDVIAPLVVPTGLKSSSTANSVTVSWNGEAAGATYTVQFENAHTGKILATDNTTSTTLTHVMPSNTHIGWRVLVHSLGSVRGSAWTKWQSVYTS